jgi:predicted molibdopterin-dependent oxidoreductase YjgC
MPEAITIEVNGESVLVAEGSMVSTAVALSGVAAFRLSVNGEPRGPLCGMGICFECRVTIDGRAHQRACQTVCRPGMQVWTDDGTNG